MSDKNFQTRSEETGLGYYDSFDAAFEAAKKDPTIHKISFSITGDRVILDKSESGQWILRPPFRPAYGALPPPGRQWMIGRTVADIEKINAEAIASGKTTAEVAELPHWKRS